MGADPAGLDLGHSSGTVVSSPCRFQSSGFTLWPFGSLSTGGTVPIRPARVGGLRGTPAWVMRFACLFSGGCWLNFVKSISVSVQMVASRKTLLPGLPAASRP